MESTAKEIRKYTVEEYLELTAEGYERTELINGEIVAFASPPLIHQDISTELTSELRRYIRKRGGKCRAYENSNVKLSDSTLVIPVGIYKYAPDPPEINIAELIAPYAAEVQGNER